MKVVLRPPLDYLHISGFFQSDALALCYPQFMERIPYSMPHYNMQQLYVHNVANIEPQHQPVNVDGCCTLIQSEGHMITGRTTARDVGCRTKGLVE